MKIGIRERVKGSDGKIIMKIEKVGLVKEKLKL